MSAEELFEQAVEVPEALRDGARDESWPEGLLERALDLRVPRSTLAFFVRDARVDARVVESVVRQRERLLLGTLRVREATWEDGDELTRLYANAPEVIGEWEVTVERGPYPFAQFRLQEHPVVYILEDRGVALATVAHSVRNTIVAGERLSTHVSSAFRVRREARGSGHGRLIYGAAEGPEWAWWAMSHYWYMRSGNFNAYNWIKDRMPEVADAPRREGEVPGLPVAVHYLRAVPVEGDASGIRKAARDDVARCVELINRTHAGLDLFRPYSAEFLETRLDDCFWGPKPSFWTPVYTWSDYVVLEEQGEVVACAGLWDRGEHLREVWHSGKTGERRVIDCTGLLDFGYAEGREDAMARLIESLLGKTRRLGRDQLIAPLEYLPELVERLASRVSGTETRSLGWRMSEESGPLRDLRPERPYTDLAYW